MKTAMSFFLIGILIGCSGTGTDVLGGQHDNVCSPGEQASCACPNGNSGSQRCADDGSEWETCQCEGSGSGTSSSSGGASGTSGTSGGGGDGSGGTGGGTTGNCLSDFGGNVTAWCYAQTAPDGSQGLDCGSAIDDCGHAIDCGGCDTTTNPYNTCGGSKTPNSQGETQAGYPNVCAGGCRTLNNAVVGGCTMPPGYTNENQSGYVVTCSLTGQQNYSDEPPPYPGKDCAYAPQFSHDYTNAWCCYLPYDAGL